MSDKLVKEIITTTTERFGDNGSIKEKVTESREKIYEYGYTDKQMAEAKVITPEPQEPAPEKELTKEELIQKVGKSLDEKNNTKKSEASATSVPTIPSATPVNPYEAYISNQKTGVVSTLQAQPTKFP